MTILIDGNKEDEFISNMMQNLKEMEDKSMNLLKARNKGTMYDLYWQSSFMSIIHVKHFERC